MIGAYEDAALTSEVRLLKFGKFPASKRGTADLFILDLSF